MLKLIHCSDTHLKSFSPIVGDILVHSGDALNYGDLSDLIQFRKQLEPLYKNYRQILFTPGNHDRIFESNFQLAEEILKETIPNIIILHNQSWICPETSLKFYGTSDQPSFCNWAFNRSNEELQKSYDNIPLDVNILITHAPAYGMRDSVWGKSVGSKELAYHLPLLTQLKAHLFGHIHASKGLTNVDNIWYSNAAMVNEMYQPVNQENIIEL